MTTLLQKIGRAKNRPFLILQALWVFSAAAAIGSLYFSEVQGLLPCELCWWQRIFMYPTVVIYGTAVYRKEIQGYVYALPLVIMGLLTSMYHYYLQIFADSTASSCSGEVSCSGTYYKVFGFITIPFGSMLIFATLAILSYYLYRITKKK